MEGGKIARSSSSSENHEGVKIREKEGKGLKKGKRFTDQFPAKKEYHPYLLKILGKYKHCLAKRNN